MNFIRLSICFLVLLGSAVLTAADRDVSVVTAESEIRLVGGFILVEAKIDGQRGTFILDTGAPDLILNSNYFPGKKQSSWSGHGLNDQIDLRERWIKKFEWLIVKKRNLPVCTIDLSNLEERTGMPIAGLIGYNILKKYELFIDYENFRVTLHPAKRSALAKRYRVVQQVPIEMQNHLPVIQVNVEGRIFRLGIDSGAETNVFHTESSKSIASKQMTTVGYNEVRGLDKQVQLVPLVTFQTSSIKENPLRRMPFALLNISQVNAAYQMQIDGLLGYPFLNAGKVSINYRTKQLTFWE